MQKEHMTGVDAIRRKRIDLSPYLFHFTKGDRAKVILSEILEERKLKSERGFLCFTETPITCMIPLLEYFGSFSSPMYSKYGIGFMRTRLVVEYNALPVIYGTKEDRALISNSLEWRFEEFNPKSHDFLWLREWRIKGNVFDLKSFPDDEIIIIAPTESELMDLVADLDFDVEFAYEHGDRMSYPYMVVNSATRKLIGFSIAEINKQKDEINDHILHHRSLSQKIGEMLYKR